MYYPVSALLIEFLILSIVDTQDSYGYEISQTIKIVADIKESTLYPILKKLEKGGFVTTYSQEFQGRKRKYYSITDDGRKQLEFLHREWNSYRDTIDGIIEGRIRNNNNCQITSKMGDVELSVPEKNLSTLVFSLDTNMGDIDIPNELNKKVVSTDNNASNGQKAPTLKIT